MSTNIQMLLGLGVSLVLLIIMLTKTKIHVFLAMLITAFLTGLLGGMEFDLVSDAIRVGFGNTLGNLGILISFGVMMGKILEKSGAAEKIARTFVSLLGDGKEDIAVGTTGFITSLAIFCVPGFVILMPLLKNISRSKKKSIVSLGVAAAGGLLLSHSLVPPASGPIGVAGIFDVNLGIMMFWGVVISIPMFVALMIMAKYLGKKYYKIPDENLVGWVTDRDVEINDSFDETTRDLPSFGASVAPILTPIILILLTTLIAPYQGQNFILDLFIILGNPIVALGLSVVVAIVLLAKDMEKSEAIAAMDEGIAGGAKIILIVGAGGALGQVVNASGVGEVLANAIAQTSIPPILLPLLISTFMRAIQGSGNVAQMTAASITAPIMMSLGVSPVFSALAVNIGSMFFSFVNDAYFWTINESMGITDIKDQVKIWSIPSTVLWAVGTISLLILNGLFG